MVTILTRIKPHITHYITLFNYAMYLVNYKHGFYDVFSRYIRAAPECPPPCWCWTAHCHGSAPKCLTNVAPTPLGAR